MNDLINEFLGLNYIEWYEMIIRVFLACFFGMIFGIEREHKNKPINFRAFMIVAMVSCTVAILGQELAYEFSSVTDGASMDLGKIIAGTLTGIGFLGAGAIMKVEDNRLVGTATGASVWAAGGIGLTLGFGYYALAFTAFIALTMILVIGGKYMNKYCDKDDMA